MSYSYTQKPGHNRPSICTASGREFSPHSPKAEDVVLEDIARSLSNVCRFGGHCRSFYSVAQHSVFVSLLLRERFPDAPDIGRIGLLHDAAEAYTGCGDVQSPMKRWVYYVPDMCETKNVNHASLRKIEIGVTRVVFERFGLEYPYLDYVKVADDDVFLYETAALMPDPEWWEYPAPPADIAKWGTFVPAGPEEARLLWLDHWSYLTARIKS